MPEPLAIAGVCTSLTIAIGRLGVAIIEFTCNVQDAKDDLRSVSKELDALKPILSNLAQVHDNGGGNFKDDLRTGIKDCVLNCEEEVQKIHNIITKHQGRGVFGDVKWTAIGQQGVNKARESLAAHKSTLSLYLNLISKSANILSDDRVTSQYRRAIGEDIGRVHARSHPPVGAQEARPGIDHVMSMISESSFVQETSPVQETTPSSSGALVVYTEAGQRITLADHVPSTQVLHDRHAMGMSRMSSPESPPMHLPRYLQMQPKDIILLSRSTTVLKALQSAKRHGERYEIPERDKIKYFGVTRQPDSIESQLRSISGAVKILISIRVSNEQGAKSLLFTIKELAKDIKHCGRGTTELNPKNILIAIVSDVCFGHSLRQSLQEIGSLSSIGTPEEISGVGVHSDIYWASISPEIDGVIHHLQTLLIIPSPYYGLPAKIKSEKWIEAVDSIIMQPRVAVRLNSGVKVKVGRLKDIWNLRQPRNSVDYYSETVVQYLQKGIRKAFT